MLGLQLSFQFRKLILTSSYLCDTLTSKLLSLRQTDANVGSVDLWLPVQQQGSEPPMNRKTLGTFLGEDFQ